MELKIETEREDDGRWIAEVTNMPNVICYGDSEEEAIAAAQALAAQPLPVKLEQKGRLLVANTEVRIPQLGTETVERTRRQVRRRTRSRN